MSRNQTLGLHWIVWVAVILASIPVASFAVYFTDSDTRSASSSWVPPSSYNNTGWIEITEGSSQYRGTGVLVANNWVLTAAHNWYASEVTALAFNIGGQSYSARSWVQHPDWISNPTVSLSQGSDLALFQLSSAVSGITPASLYTGTQELGSEVTFFGAGLTGSGTSGLQSNSSADLFAGNNTIDRIISPSSGGLLAFDLDDGTTERNTLGSSGLFDIYGNSVSTSPDWSLEGDSSDWFQTAFEASTAPGDSGGPAFADFGNGPELIGLTSWGVNPSEPSNPYGSGLGDITYLTRISSHADWINGVIPEPSSVLLFLVGGACCFFLRGNGQ